MRADGKIKFFEEYYKPKMYQNCSICRKAMFKA
jgi:hypothetical protein